MTDRERLQWSVLNDLVLEDLRALWEVDSAAASLFPGLPETERRNLAAAAMQELVSDGSAYLFNLGGLEPDVAAADDRLRIERDRADDLIVQALGGAEMRVGREVWVAPTESGKRLVNEGRRDARP